MPEFTVLTLNTWKCDGDYARRLPVMARALARLAPDVILLQEVFASADGVWDTGMYLAEQLGLYRAFHPARFKTRPLHGDATEGYSGLAVLGRSIIRQHRTISLPGNDSDPQRAAQTLVIEFGGRSLRIMNTHLTHVCAADDLRRRQMQTIIDFLHDEGGDHPTVLGGDFNAEPNEPSIRWLENQNHYPLKRAAMNEATLWDAPRCVDHLMVNSALQVLYARRALDEREACGLMPSDHYGVMARIALADA